jgi:hypothetical protein
MHLLLLPRLLGDLRVGMCGKQQSRWGAQGVRVVDKLQLPTSKGGAGVVQQAVQALPQICVFDMAYAHTNSM